MSNPTSEDYLSVASKTRTDHARVALPWPEPSRMRSMTDAAKSAGTMLGAMITWFAGNLMAVVLIASGLLVVGGLILTTAFLIFVSDSDRIPPVFQL